MGAMPTIKLSLGDQHIDLPITITLTDLQQPSIAPEIPKAMKQVKIGDYWAEQGGVFAGLMRGEAGKPDYFLIVPTDSKAYNPSITWGGYEEEQGGACSDFDGLANTLHLVELGEGKHPAACWAAGLEIAGHKDFYLPAKKELALMYATVGDLFETGDWYWSSTQYSKNSAWVQTFVNGHQTSNDKTSYGYRARAVRRLLVIQ
jgi:hypothetical protein